jgi:HK97 family phage major capsid protein
MSKLKSLVANAVKEMQSEINSVAKGALDSATAKAPTVSAPKEIVSGSAIATLKSLGDKAERLGELAFIAKAARGGNLVDADMADLDGRFKAIGVTTDIASLLPTGFTGALIRDIQARLVVTALFPYKETAPGQYDSIALNGITGYLVAEAVAGTESAEAYTTMMYLVQKCMATVKKSYEALNDSLIPLADEVRMEIVDALARAIEDAVVNGDDTATHMDAGVAATSFKKAFKGLRKLARAKQTVDFGGLALTEADWLTYISSMQEKGGVYLDDQQVSAGNVVLLVSQNVYNQLRMLPSFLTRDKAAGNATLFGAAVDTIFGIPVVMTPFLPKVDATGVVHATAGNNVLGTIILANRQMFKFYATGAPMMESFRDIFTQFVGFTGSIRCGFNGIYDRTSANPALVDATRKTAVAGINIKLI